MGREAMMSLVDNADSGFDEPLLIPAPKVARLLNMSVRTLWRNRSAGNVPQPVRIGATVRWSVVELEKWIADGCPKHKARDNEGLRRR
jgi:predicted DNA-binding transcriptional regulator AlpA